MLVHVVHQSQNQSSSSIMRSYGQVASSASSAAVTTDTDFMLASVSKVFVGAAVLSLIDQGILQSLDDDICDVLPDEYKESTACRHYGFPNQTITWRMLVTHRSGLRRDFPYEVQLDNGQTVDPGYGPTGGYAGRAAGNPTCPLDDVKGFYIDLLVDKITETTVGSGGLTIDGKPLNWYDVGSNNGSAYLDWRPGSDIKYSNFGVGYIAALVEFATNQTFQEFCRDNIFNPLGMNQTSWFREDLPAGTPVAVPVEFIGNGQYQDHGHYW
jgi:CubicO group peptidase (beta-lactamase class C family)